MKPCAPCVLCVRKGIPLPPADLCSPILHRWRQDWAEMAWNWWMKASRQGQLSTTAGSCFQGEALNEERLHHRLCITTTIIRSRMRCSGSGMKCSFCCSGSSFGNGVSDFNAESAVWVTKWFWTTYSEYLSLLILKGLLNQIYSNECLLNLKENKVLLTLEKA